MKPKALSIPILLLVVIAASCDRSRSGPTANKAERRQNTNPPNTELLPAARVCSARMPSELPSVVNNIRNTAAEEKDGETMHYGWLDRATPEVEYRRTVLHEFGHALGAIHEHQSPGGEIKWNKDVVYAWCASNNPPWNPKDCDENIINR